jgi:outer membrane lipoprotein-sorting protein
MKLKSTFFLPVFFCLSLGSTAQQKGLGSNDPEAKKVLDAVSARFKTYKTVKAAFTVKGENAAGKSLLTKSGTIYMRDKKYRVSITGQEIYSDGSTVSTYDKAANEITITKLDQGSSTITPQKLFTNFYDKDYLYKLNGDATFGGKKMKEIELTPTDKSKPFFKVMLYVDQVSGFISGAKLFEKTGNRYTYSISSMNPNIKLDESLFVLDAGKYPGVEMVDLR